jgi:hypothetical protein
MRSTIIALLLVSLLGALCWAQESSPTAPSPAAVASPGQAQVPGMKPFMRPPMAMGPSWRWHHRYAPSWCGPYPRPRRGVRIVFFVLHVLLALSGIFALTALGIFLLRRSRSGP